MTRATGRKYLYTTNIKINPTILKVASKTKSIAQELASEAKKYTKVLDQFSGYISYVLYITTEQ